MAIERSNLDEAPVHGIDARIDESLNEKFRLLSLAIRAIEDKLGNLEPGGEPGNPSEGDIRLADGVTWDPAGTGNPALVVLVDGVWRALGWLGPSADGGNYW